MQREIDQLDHHISSVGMVGWGRLADSLRQQRRSLLMVDSNPHRIREARAAGFLAIEGNATEEGASIGRYRTRLHSGFGLVRRCVQYLSDDYGS